MGVMRCKGHHISIARNTHQRIATKRDIRVCVCSSGYWDRPQMKLSTRTLTERHQQPATHIVQTEFKECSKHKTPLICYVNVSLDPKLLPNPFAYFNSFPMRVHQMHRTQPTFNTRSNEMIQRICNITTNILIIIIKTNDERAHATTQLTRP